MSKKTKSRKLAPSQAKEFSVLSHVLVPKHEVLSEEEAKKVLEEYGVSPNQLPYMLVSDPVAKAIGAKEGDIVKIIRSSETAGTSVYYRYVVREVT